MSLLYRPLFPTLYCLHFFRWFIKAPQENESMKLISTPSIISIPDSTMTSQVILTDVMLLNHWFIAIMEGLNGYVYGTLLMLLYMRTQLSLDIVSLTIKVFFLSKLKEPPDTCSKSNSITNSILDAKLKAKEKPKVFIDLDNYEENNTKSEKEFANHLIWDDKLKSMHRQMLYLIW